MLETCPVPILINSYDSVYISLCLPVLRGKWKHTKISIYMCKFNANSVHFLFFITAYGRNQSGCEKAKKSGNFTLYTLGFLTIYILFALMKMTICFKHLEVSNIISCDSWYYGRLSDFKLSKKPFQFMKYVIKKKFQPKIQEIFNLIAEWM